MAWFCHSCMFEAGIQVFVILRILRRRISKQIPVIPNLIRNLILKSSPLFKGRIVECVNQESRVLKNVFWMPHQVRYDINNKDMIILADIPECSYQ